VSDPIGHYCGLAFLRLRKPLSWYAQHYGDPAWGMRRLHLLMQKQYNRGQDGAGVAVAKFDMPPGLPFLRRLRSSRNNALERISDALMRDMKGMRNDPLTPDNEAQWMQRAEFLGNAYLGHLRYGTHAGRSVNFCHPLIRKDNTPSRNLALAGNFNMTNSPQLFQRLVDFGLHPVGDSDTQVVLERIGYCLDLEHRHLRNTMGPGSFLGLEGRALTEAVAKEIDIARVLRQACEDWDGGWLFGGLLGSGDGFVFRDPSGIRPGFWYEDDEVVAAASERAPLTSVFDVDPEHVKEIEPGTAVIVRRDGTVHTERYIDEQPRRECTFERIYFSRGNDPAIYEERKCLGRQLAEQVLDMVDWDVQRTVYSFVPNTAETAFYGLVAETRRLVRAHQVEALWAHIQQGQATREEIETLVGPQVRADKIAHKDQRLRTFITHDAARRDLVMHVYDITRSIVAADDTLVVLDDSIVRGTTLRESIVTILARLNPKRIVVVSSAPLIKYPDCYGIDMSHLNRFVAFQAAIALLQAQGGESLLDEIEADCRAQLDRPDGQLVNHVRRLYDPFSDADLGAKVAELVRPADVPWQGRLDVVYQSLEGLRAAMPQFTGDWYFSGDYPTPGGLRVLNRSYLNWREGVDARAY
jgi:amidophosphoribosyltransferase